MRTGGGKQGVKAEGRRFSPATDHIRPHDGAERVDDARETRDGLSVALPVGRVCVCVLAVAVAFEVTGAFAVYVLETMICKVRVRPLWRVIVVRGLASWGNGEGHLGFEAGSRLVQPEDLFCIGLVDKGMRGTVRRKCRREDHLAASPDEETRRAN
ncbi:hypothetical protein EDB85DRAFT_1558964 [Lactarius pseudohatsudake]|nr:hypothetical protein EDB85DRAFT_1558964 [Lactarius pseudohatsudake]